MAHHRSWASSAGLALAPTLILAGALLASPASAQRAPGPLTADQLDKLVPKHPGYLGALAPENLKKKRPAPGFDMTGTWFIDLSEGFSKFMFGPPYPEFLPDAAQAYAEGQAAAKARVPYRDAIGQCYPPGMPMIMTRVWPLMFVQLPTVIYMVAGFENSFRAIYLDGRGHSDPDTVVHTYNGESIGHWEGKTLVVETRYIEPDNHYIDNGLPVSDEFRMTERITMVDGGKALQIEYIMVDPQNWKGEWRNTKRWNRTDYTDIGEVECILANNAHLPGTDLGNSVVPQGGEGKEGGATKP